MSNFAASDFGVGYAQMLQAYGKTPSEWGALDADERYFLESAWREERQREHDELNDSGLPT